MEEGAAARSMPISSALARCSFTKASRIRDGERQPAAPGSVGAGGDLAAMYPQQQLRFVHPVPRAVGVGSGERLVNLAHTTSRTFRLGRRPECARLDELSRSSQPGPGIHWLRNQRYPVTVVPGK
jgi:hypothetical protein